MERILSLTARKLEDILRSLKTRCSPVVLRHSFRHNEFVASEFEAKNPDRLDLPQKCLLGLVIEKLI